MANLPKILTSNNVDQNAAVRVGALLCLENGLVLVMIPFHQENGKPAQELDFQKC